MEQIHIENIIERLTKWCKILFRFNNYVLIKLERPDFVFGVGNVDFKYAIESTANDIYFWVYHNQIHYANKQITSAKSEAMEQKLRELGYSIEANIGYVEKLTKDSITKNIINPQELFKIEKL